MSIKLDEDLYSRQLYVLGVDAMKNLNDSTIFISGMSGLGVEIAKNIILSGVKKVVLHDKQNLCYQDFGTNFYAVETYIGINRALSVKNFLAELNSYVEVDYCDHDLTEELLKHYNVVVLVDYDLQSQIELNNICRKNNIKFISTKTISVFGQIFIDFGNNFLVKDIDGEEPNHGLIESIEFNDEYFTVKTVESMPHNLSSGDVVEFNLKDNDYIEDNKFEIKYKDKYTFICNRSKTNNKKFVADEFKQIKLSKYINFKSLAETLKEPEIIQTDFLNLNRNQVLHACFISYDSLNFSETFKNYYMLELSDSDKKMVELFQLTKNGKCIFTNSVIGGFVAQEIIKACSNKFFPIKQYLYFESIDSIPDNLKINELERTNDRYLEITQVLGKSMIDKMKQTYLFLVGAGAIGCELLKNFTMAGIACGDGKIIITDMDTIEKSNLNRQFLFRPSDIGHMKSECASKAVKKMNSDLNIDYHTTRVGAETSYIYNAEFFKKNDIIVNALDNIEARKYVDSECVRYQKPLLESGTSGTKGNIQIIVPHLTESYSETRDPPAKDFPVCTIKTFPYEIEHVIQWAKEKFNLFSEVPLIINRYLDNPECIKEMNTNLLKNFNDDIQKLLITRFCSNFTDCIKNSLLEWHADYRDQINNILEQFPSNHVNSEGALFWSGTKRCPTSFKFDINNQIHMDYIISMSNLFADVYNLNRCTDIKIITSIVNELLPKIEQIKQKTHIRLSEEEEKIQNIDEMIKSLPDPEKFKNIRLNVLKFEKDDNTNFHMDFICACANMRALNYNIQTADRRKIKGIAGKIIPAIATTTGIVAGLVCFELLKILNKVDRLDKYRNYFLNLAIPFLTYSEPGKTKTFNFNGQKYSSWSNTIIMKGDLTIEDIINNLKNYFKNDKLNVDMLGCGQVSLYSAFSPMSNIELKLKTPIKELLKTVNNFDKLNNNIKIEALLCEENSDDAELFNIEYYF